MPNFNQDLRIYNQDLSIYSRIYLINMGTLFMVYFIVFTITGATPIQHWTMYKNSSDGNFVIPYEMLGYGLVFNLKLSVKNIFYKT